VKIVATVATIVAWTSLSAALSAALGWGWSIAASERASAQSASKQSIASSSMIPSRSFLFDAFTIDQGLSQGTAVTMLQDKRGFLWFGTQDGLNRYDGYVFKSYKNSPLDRFSLSNSHILALTQDHGGNLWVATNGGGLNVYNAKLDRFTAFQITPANATAPRSRPPSNIITALATASGNKLWVGTDRGLCTFEPPQSLTQSLSQSPTQSSRSTDTNATFHHITKQSTNGGLPDDNITALLVDKTGTLWVGTVNGLASWDGTAWRNWHTQNSQSTQINNKSTPTLPSKNITALYESPSGAIWVGTNAGLVKMVFPPSPVRVNPAITLYTYNLNNSLGSDSESGLGTDSENDLGSDLRSDQSLSANYVHCITEANDGTLWVGTRGGGLSLLNLSSGTWTTIRMLETERNGLLSDVVRCVFQDRQGMMWIGTSGQGINRYNPHQYPFRTIRHKPRNPNSLSNNIVWSFCLDRAGMLWVGTFNAGLNRYNPRSQQWTHYRHNEMDSRSIASDGVNAILEDSRGYLWLGTNDGLSVMDRAGSASSTNSARTFRASDGNISGVNILSHSTVRCMIEDHDGVIWLGTAGGGLNRMALPSNAGKTASVAALRPTFTSYTYNAANPQSLPHNNIATLYEDRAGTLWVGTWGGGLCKFDRTSGIATTYRFDPMDATSLSSNFIRSITEDPDGTLWIGTNGGGLNHFDPKKGICTLILQEKNGLPNNVVYGVLLDDSANVWMSTNRGIARYNPRSQGLRLYNSRDGLQSNEFNTGAALRTANGEMYFGGMQGFNIFHPSDITENTFVPPVVLTDFKVLNRSMRLDSSVSEAQTIELDAKASFFAFEFAALNFIASEKNQYRYKLEGFNKDWIDAQGKREATYTNIDGGTYTFRVRASNNDGVWNDAGLSVRVIVHPPWWKTLWARGLALLLVAGAIGAWLRWRTYQIRTQKIELERQVQQRTAELDQSNREVQRQVTILDNQAREIELANTELQMVNNWMEEKNTELATLNNEKNEIMGIVAHDLKNPLSNIRLLARMLKSDAPKLAAPDVEDFAQDIETSADRMFDLITNLLNVNQIEQGGMQLVAQPFDLVDLLKILCNDYRPRAEAKNIALHCEILVEEDSPNTMAIALADRNATVQALDNLISNAIKYSPFDKNVFVRLRRSSRTNMSANRFIHTGSSLAMLRVEVADEGPGLSPEDQTKLFGKFARLSAKPTGGEHSTGLGLSIVKKLVESMNGNVWCESSLGKGATFIMELPMFVEDMLAADAA
jgi:signal transduction histidine kinase/ligand-binding sensor domain-containing protein